MKAIFLDIDGVMNDEKHILELYNLMEQGKLNHETYVNTYHMPYERSLNLLKK